jgi:hypothetical protein
MLSTLRTFLRSSLSHSRFVAAGGDTGPEGIIANQMGPIRRYGTVFQRDPISPVSKCST